MFRFEHIRAFVMKNFCRRYRSQIFNVWSLYVYNHCSRYLCTMQNQPSRDALNAWSEACWRADLIDALFLSSPFLLVYFFLRHIFALRRDRSRRNRKRTIPGSKSFTQDVRDACITRITRSYVGGTKCNH